MWCAMSTCLVLQHVAPESPFAVAEALTGAGVRVQTRRVFAGEALPDDLTGVDGLVVMGGPMAAHSEVGFPTRSRELALIAEALRIGIPTLGICLGAQLVVAAVDGRVYPGAGGPEIGWSPVTLSKHCGSDRLLRDLPETLTVLQWHGDTFDLPAGAVLLASNDRYPNQAFRLGELAWGLQFHLEVTESAIEGFLDEFAADTDSIDGGADAIRAAIASGVANLAAARGLVCTRFAELVAQRVTAADRLEEVPAAR
jgi:GMP synthase-like glutamine amidotransferase